MMGSLGAVLVAALAAVSTGASAPATAGDPSSKIAPPVREAALAVLNHLAAGGGGADPSNPHAHHSQAVFVNPDGELLVHVVLARADPQALPRLAAAGLRVERVVGSGRLILGWVAPTALDGIAALDIVEQIRPFAASRPRR